MFFLKKEKEVGQKKQKLNEMKEIKRLKQLIEMIHQSNCLQLRNIKAMVMLENGKPFAKEE
jgi:hypothetical protein